MTETTSKLKPFGQGDWSALRGANRIHKEEEINPFIWYGNNVMVVIDGDEEHKGMVNITLHFNTEEVNGLGDTFELRFGHCRLHHAMHVAEAIIKVLERIPPK